MIDYKIVIGLICVMLANVLFGSSLAKVKQEFEKKRFWNGFYKAIMITIGVILMCVTAYFNPDILMISINNTNLNLKDGMETIIIAGIAMYGAMDLKKIAQLIGVSTIVNDVKETSIVTVPEENYIKRDDV